MNKYYRDVMDEEQVIEWCKTHGYKLIRPGDGSPMCTCTVLQIPSGTICNACTFTCHTCGRVNQLDNGFDCECCCYGFCSERCHTAHRLEVREGEREGA